MKKANYFVSLICIGIMQLLYFLWQPYPKSLIKTVGYPYALSDIITGIIYFAVFFTVLYMCFMGVNRAGRRYKLFDRAYWKLMAALFAVQLITDVLKELAFRAAGDFGWTAYSAFTVLSWLLFALVFVRMFKLKETAKKEKQGNRGIYVALGVALICLCISIALDVDGVLDRRLLLEKYKETSKLLSYMFLNSHSRHQFVNLLLDFVCAVSFLSLFYKYGSLEIPKKARDAYRPGTPVVRLMVLPIAVLILYLAKALVLPYGAILPGDVDNDWIRSTHYENREEFNITSADVLIVTRTIDVENKSPVCCLSTGKIWYNGETLCSFYGAGPYTSRGGINDDYTMSYNGVQVVSTDSANAAIYANSTLVWVAGEKDRSINLNAIAYAGENDILTEICRNRIEFGDLRFFDFGYKYLLKYDPEFIAPHIERLAAGNFTGRELSYNSDYRPEYIQQLAESLLHELT